MHHVHQFRKDMEHSVQDFLEWQSRRFPRKDTLKIDLHCHDKNSDVPDELWGRILRIPETWLPTDDLVRCLRANGTDAITVTNHNNAKSCWDLLDKGVDVLPGSEFTCTFKDMDIQIHLLTYGFTPAQEEKLKVLRRDIYKFMEFTTANDLPTVQPHPLYFYNPNKRPPLEAFERFALLFERFEALNGQRDTWQNQLTISWLNSLTPEKIDAWSRKHGISPSEFCKDPYKKQFTGGSDDHMGLFAGSCGALLHVPNLEQKQKTMKSSEIALEALRNGDIAPYGHIAEEEKLNIAFLDYFSQIAINMKDPGLFRMFLHRGTLKDKLTCLLIANGMQELQRHKYTMKFFHTFHDALMGKRPGLIKTWAVSKDYRPMMKEIDTIAASRKQGPEHFLNTLRETIPALHHQLGSLFIDRLKTRLAKNTNRTPLTHLNPEEVVRKFEVSSQIRHLFSGETGSNASDISAINLSDLMDSLSFPLLAGGVMIGSSFASSKVLYNNRAFLNQFADKIGSFRHPKRILWLTDTLHDRNGVSSVLQATLNEVRRRDLPIDFMICDKERQSEPHLQVVPAIAEFTIPEFDNQILRVPDLLHIQKVFRQGGYDRIICSTELTMGLVALFLKSAFSVPAHFYMHTDWLDFFEKNTNLDTSSLDRVRRTLRAFYKRFDGIFVLNSEHQAWLASPAIGIPAARIHQTAHWVDERFRPHDDPKVHIFPGVQKEERVMLFAGRISDEKGVRDLPAIYKAVKSKVPLARMVFAGQGPAQERLQREMPDAVFLGWVDPEQLPAIYSAADILLLPSRFDTFGCVVLEAMSCACPVAAYDTKGPADIISNGINGFLSKDAKEMATQISQYMLNDDMAKPIRTAAVMRGNDYCPDHILDALMRDMGMVEDEPKSRLFLKVTATVRNAKKEIGMEPTIQEGLINELLHIVE